MFFEKIDFFRKRCCLMKDQIIQVSIIALKLVKTEWFCYIPLDNRFCDFRVSSQHAGFGKVWYENIQKNTQFWMLMIPHCWEPPMPNFKLTLFRAFKVQFSFPLLKRIELVQTLPGVSFFFPYSRMTQRKYEIQV